MTTIMNQWIPIAWGLKPIKLTLCPCMVSKPCPVHKSLKWIEFLHFLGLFSFLTMNFLRTFLMWAIFKVFIEFVTILLLFSVLAFWPRGTWDLSSSTRDWTCSPCIGRQRFNRFLGLPRKSHPLNLCTFMQLFLFSLNFIVPHPFPW